MAGERSGTVCSLFNLLKLCSIGVRGANTLQQEIAVAVNHGEQIVEIVGHSSCEPADSLHFLGLQFFRSSDGVLCACVFALQAIKHESQGPYHGHKQHNTVWPKMSLEDVPRQPEEPQGDYHDCDKAHNVFSLTLSRPQRAECGARSLCAFEHRSSSPKDFQRCSERFEDYKRRILAQYCLIVWRGRKEY